MKVRYIRDKMSGNTFNTGCHWLEIQTLNYDGINVALNKKVTTENIIANGTLSMVTDGDFSTKTNYLYLKGDGGLKSITIDLGKVENIDVIKVWHYYGEDRKYNNVLLETSIDGVKWTTIFDSNASGEYLETVEGKTHKLPIEEELVGLNEGATLNDIVTFYEKYLENNKQNKEFLKNVLINKSANVDDNDRMFDLINKVQDIKTGVNVTINNSVKVDYDFNLTLSSVSWVNASTIQRNFYNGSAVVYNNEIHILGGQGESLKHHKYNGSSWSKVSDLPYNFYTGSAVVLNNEIHILGGTNSTYYKYHYKYDGASWTEVSTLPYDFRNGSAVVFNNEIHILGSSDSVTKHYKYDGSTWTQVSTLPYEFAYSNAVVLNNEIHILGSGYSSYYNQYHYKWNGSTWTQVSTLPYYFYNSSAVVYNNEIHILGSGYSSYHKYHYKYDGSTWTQVSTLLYNFYNGSAVVLNNEIHILGSSNSSSYYKNHYRAKNYYELERL